MAQERRVLPEGETYPDQLARRFPMKLPKPNSILIMVLVLLAVGMLILTTISREDKPFTGVKGQIETAPVVSQAQVKELQPVPAVPVAKEWPKVEVVWREVPPTPGVDLLNPIQGDGFYTGTMNTPNGGVATPEGLAFIATILPQLKEGGMVAAARDSVDKNVVFVSITGYNNRSYLFLSVDGEKSWHEVNLAPVNAPVAGSHAVRVRVDDGFIRLVARDNVVGEKLWGATVELTS